MPFPSRSSTSNIVIRLAIVALFLIVVVTILATFLLAQSDPEMRKLGYKTVELAIQVFLVVITGGVAVQEYNRVQARRAALNESRKVMLRQLIQAYSRTKKARRLLRAKCVLIAGEPPEETNRAVEYEGYSEHLGCINEINLDLEIIARELKVIQNGFTCAETLRIHVKTMEKSLDELVDEYERALGECDPKQSIHLSRLPNLKAFIAKGSETFGTYSAAFHDALALIQAEKLKG